MNLVRLFVGLALASLMILVVTGGILYGVTEHNSHAANLQFHDAIATGAARNLEQRMNQLSTTIEGFAEMPALIDLFRNGDVDQLAAEADSLQRLLPYSLRVRLLLPDTKDPDNSLTPHMGYADLEMAQSALQSNPQPAVHEDRTPNGHLAIARKIAVRGDVIGIVLTSFSTDIIKKILAETAILDGAIELKQGTLSLGFNGNQDLKSEDPSGEVPVIGMNWEIKYWVRPSTFHRTLMFLGIMSVAIALVILLFFYSFRWLADIVKSDLESFSQVIKDLKSGKLEGNYPVKLEELEGIIGKLAQLKQKANKFGPYVGPEQNHADDSVPDSMISPGLAPRGEGLVVDSEEDKAPALVKSEQGNKVPAAIFRAYDIRGVVDESLMDNVGSLASHDANPANQLSAAIVCDIGQAIGSEVIDLGQQTVLIARDGRLSSPSMSEALAKGLQSSGCHVIDIGIAPTPLLYFATHQLPSNSGVMITGSHNPRDYNGLKIVINGETLSGDTIQRLRQRIEGNDLRCGKGSYETQDLLADYIGVVTDDTQIGRPMKIVVDCGNGVAGKVAPVLLKTLGCDVIELYCEIDGNFPNHHPNPGDPLTLKDLIDTVKTEKADLGVAFDGDGDRLGVVDSAGKIIWPDRQLMLFAADVLSRNPGADVIYDVKCSRDLATEIVKHGGRPIMWKTGHSLIKAKLKETGALLGGEMSGHIYFKERWFGFDDAIYACARLMEILSAETRSSHKVFADFPESISTPELNVSLAEGQNVRFITDLLATAQFNDAKVTTIDGLRVDFTDGWGLIRASNTTPSLVLRFEAENEQALRRIQEQFRKLMLSIDKNIKLPF